MVLQRQPEYRPSYPTADPQEASRVAPIGPDSDVLISHGQAHLVNYGKRGEVFESLPATPGEVALCRQALAWMDVCSTHGIDARDELRLGRAVITREVDDCWRYRWQALELRAIPGTARVLHLYTTLPRGLDLLVWLEVVAGVYPLEAPTREASVLRYPDGEVIDVRSEPIPY